MVDLDYGLNDPKFEAIEIDVYPPEAKDLAAQASRRRQVERNIKRIVLRQPKKATEL